MRETSVKAGTGFSFAGIGKKYGEHHVLRDISLEIAQGTFLCLLGPSGCGKTTMLRCIAGLEQPGSGVITIGNATVFDASSGTMVPADRRGLGMVFQHYALWPHMSVRENIAYPLRRRQVGAQDRGGSVERLARLVGLEGHLDKRPNQLSGGQQQRVALARALAGDPRLLLLDEPLSNLDAVLRHQLRRELRSLHDRLGMTSVLVTHDQEEAAALADVVAIMQDGLIVQSGTPAEVFEKPASRYVAEFVGYECFLSGTVGGKSADTMRVVLSNGESVVLRDDTGFGPGAAVSVAARGQDVALTAKSGSPCAAGSFSGRILNRARLGTVVEHQVEVSGQTFWVRNAGESDLQEGDEVWVRIPESSPIFLDKHK